MNNVNLKVMNNHSKKYLISSIENVINKSIDIHTSLVDYIKSIKSIMKDTDKSDMDTKIEQESIGIYQKGLESSIEVIKKLEKIDSITNWMQYTNEIFFIVINIYNIHLNLNNLLKFIKSTNILELNSYDFSESKLLNMNAQKEVIVQENSASIYFVKRMMETVNKLYLKYLKTVVSCYKEWFQDFTFYQNFNVKLESNQELTDLYIRSMKLLLTKVDKKMKLYIMRHIEIMKDKSMLAHIDDNLIFDDQDMKILSNTIQFFNIVSLEEHNRSLYDVCLKLYNIKNAIFRSIKESPDTHIRINILLDQLIHILNMYSTTKGIKYGIILFYNNNDDLYFDLTKLLKNDSFKMIERYNGVNRSYINLYNNLKHHVVVESLFNSDMCISINIDRATQRAHVLHTNDMRSFKIQSNFKYEDLSIDFPLIKNIIRNSPSKRISNYNAIFSEAITKQVDETLKLKYNDFKELEYSNVEYSNGELYAKLIELFKHNLQLYSTEVTNRLENMTPNVGLTSIINDEKFYDVLNKTILHFYKTDIMSNKIRQYNKEIVGEVYITGLAVIDKITKRIKKEIVRYVKNHSITNLYTFIENTVPLIISNVVKPDLSIYDKIIEKEYKLIELVKL